MVFKLTCAAVVSLMVTVVLFFVLAGLIVSGGEPVRVPNLIGKSIVDAHAQIKDSGLKIDLAGSRYSPIVPQDSIISQDPAPGRMVKSTRTVRVVLSRGTEMIQVPDITGGDVRQAVVELTKIGLKPKSQVRIHYPARADIVIGQDPPAGSLLPRDSGVDFLVSLGAPRVSYAMPNLINKPLDEVTELLNSLNLKISNKREMHEDTPEDVVFYQDPLPGMYVSEGETVRTKVSASGEMPEWQTLEGAVIRYDVPLGFVQRRVRIDVQDALGRSTEFDKLVDPGTTIRIPVVYRKWLDVEVRLDGREVDRRFIREMRDTRIPADFFQYVYPSRPYRVQWRP